MNFALYHDALPQSKSEFHYVQVQRVPSVPDGRYLLEDGYCVQRGCDCRRAMIMVRQEATDKVAATISYGWESRRFYKKWLGVNDKEMIAEMKGPSLWRGAQQEPYAKAILEAVRPTLESVEFQEHLKTRYQKFKNHIDQTIG